LNQYKPHVYYGSVHYNFDVHGSRVARTAGKWSNGFPATKLSSLLKDHYRPVNCSELDPRCTVTTCPIPSQRRRKCSRRHSLDNAPMTNPR